MVPYISKLNRQDTTTAANTAALGAVTRRLESLEDKLTFVASVLRDNADATTAQTVVLNQLFRIISADTSDREMLRALDDISAKLDRAPLAASGPAPALVSEPPVEDRLPAELTARAREVINGLQQAKFGSRDTIMGIARDKLVDEFVNDGTYTTEQVDRTLVSQRVYWEIYVYLCEEQVRGDLGSALKDAQFDECQARAMAVPNATLLDHEELGLAIWAGIEAAQNARKASS